jgi:branched-chain amino acid transport system permease protein
MTLLVATLWGGFAIGATLALIVLGMVLIYRATDTFNFAQGQFMLIPAYLVGKWQSQHTMSFFVALAVSVVVISLISALLYGVVLRRTIGMPLFIPVVATLGFAAVLDGIIGMIFRSRLYNISIPSIPHGTIGFAGVHVGTASIVLSVFAFALGISVALIIRYTSVGARMRAAGQDSLLASQGGINVRRIYLWSWIIAAVLAGIGGIAYGSTNVVSPSMLDLAFLAFPALLLGGFDSIPGALVGGLIVGIIQSVTSAYVGSQYIPVTTYSLILIVLLVRPRGLLGTQAVARV